MVDDDYDDDDDDDDNYVPEHHVAVSPTQLGRHRTQAHL